MISIDPGRAGAIVNWEASTPLSIIDMTYFKSRLDLIRLKEIFAELKPGVVVIEDVTSAPRAGVVSASNFLYNVGALHTASVFSGAHLIRLPIKRWKNVMGMYGKPKPYALEIVKRLMPEQFEKMIDPYPNRVDRAEAVLMGLAYFKLGL